MKRNNDKDSELIEEDKGMATLLNEYFASVFNGNESAVDKISNLIDASKKSSVDEIIITQEDVVKAISDFKTNKSPGIDNITSTYALKIKNTVAYPLQLLFNKSLETSVIPID